MEFKDKVRFVRKKMIMSQHEFAKALGVSYPTLLRWESGKTEANYKGQRAFHDICAKNNITIED